MDSLSLCLKFLPVIMGTSSRIALKSKYNFILFFLVILFADTTCSEEIPIFKRVFEENMEVSVTYNLTLQKISALAKGLFQGYQTSFAEKQAILTIISVSCTHISFLIMICIILKYNVNRTRKLKGLLPSNYRTTNQYNFNSDSEREDVIPDFSTRCRKKYRKKSSTGHTSPIIFNISNSPGVVVNSTNSSLTQATSNLLESTKSRLPKNRKNQKKNLGYVNYNIHSIPTSVEYFTEDDVDYHDKWTRSTTESNVDKSLDIEYEPCSKPNLRNINDEFYSTREKELFVERQSSQLHNRKYLPSKSNLHKTSDNNINETSNDEMTNKRLMLNDKISEINEKEIVIPVHENNTNEKRMQSQISISGDSAFISDNSMNDNTEPKCRDIPSMLDGTQCSDMSNLDDLQQHIDSGLSSKVTSLVCGRSEHETNISEDKTSPKEDTTVLDNNLPCKGTEEHEEKQVLSELNQRMATSQPYSQDSQQLMYQSLTLSSLEANHSVSDLNHIGVMEQMNLTDDLQSKLVNTTHPHNEVETATRKFQQAREIYEIDGPSSSDDENEAVNSTMAMLMVTDQTFSGLDNPDDIMISTKHKIQQINYARSSCRTSNTDQNNCTKMSSISRQITDMDIKNKELLAQGNNESFEVDGSYSSLVTNVSTGIQNYHQICFQDKCTESKNEFYNSKEKDYCFSVDGSCSSTEFVMHHEHPSPTVMQHRHKKPHTESEMSHTKNSSTLSIRYRQIPGQSTNGSEDKTEIKHLSTEEKSTSLHSLSQDSGGSVINTEVKQIVSTNIDIGQYACSYYSSYDDNDEIYHSESNDNKVNNGSETNAKVLKDVSHLSYMEEIKEKLGIDLRVDDAISNTAGALALANLASDDPYNWSNLNEPSLPADVYEDSVPVARQLNRPIYESLKRIDWVMGYFSTGGVIDVFVDLEGLDTDWVMQELCRLTGQPPSKFNIKDNNDEMSFWD